MGNYFWLTGAQFPVGKSDRADTACRSRPRNTVETSCEERQFPTEICYWICYWICHGDMRFFDWSWFFCLSFVLLHNCSYCGYSFFATRRSTVWSSQWEFVSRISGDFCNDGEKMRFTFQFSSFLFYFQNRKKLKNCRKKRNLKKLEKKLEKKRKKNKIEKNWKNYLKSSVFLLCFSNWKQKF